MKELELRQHAQEIRSLSGNLAKVTVETSSEIGWHLTEAKKLCGHGKWLPWLKENFDWNHTSASRYMRVYETGAKFKLVNLTNFDLSAIYELASNRLTDEDREDIIKVSKNKKLTLDDIKKRPSVKKKKDPTSPMLWFTGIRNALSRSQESVEWAIKELDPRVESMPLSEFERLVEGAQETIEECQKFIGEMNKLRGKDSNVIAKLEALANDMRGNANERAAAKVKLEQLRGVA
jgi:hypothetical protein